MLFYDLCNFLNNFFGLLASAAVSSTPRVIKKLVGTNSNDQIMVDFANLPTGI